MTMIDDKGRLFGRLNLVDALAAVFFLVLIPLGYGTFLLFRPAVPHIDSVSPAAINKEERRISTSAHLLAKFKVKGTGLNPLLRARIGDTPALAFVFESPNSADVLVGPLSSPGPHDLILVDGINEVARAVGAINIKPGEATVIRASGRLVDLEASQVKELQVGLAFPSDGPAFRILALGPVEPSMSRLYLAHSQTDLPREGLFERDAVLMLRCDPGADQNPCAMEDSPAARLPTVAISLPSPTRFFGFALEEIFPDAAPTRARVVVQLEPGRPGQLVRAGDRDALLDERAAIVTGSDAGRLTLDLGVDQSREGWRYRSRLVRPGSPFVLSTAQSDVTGHVESITLTNTPSKKP